MSTLLAAFTEPKNAIKAAGALLDHGIKKEHLDLLAGQSFANGLKVDGTHDEDAEKKAEHGVTTTTARDAAEGAKKGAGAGAVLGALAGLASLFIPGYGIVVGGGALATAIATAVGTTAAGAAAGGTTGYLKDMGVPGDVAEHYDETIKNDGAVLSVNLPSKKVTEVQVRELLAKYNVGRIHSSDHTVI